MPVAFTTLITFMSLTNDCCFIILLLYWFLSNYCRSERTEAVARTLGPAAFARSGAVAGAPSNRTETLAGASPSRTETLAGASPSRTGYLAGAPSSRTKALARALSSRTETLTGAPPNRTGDLAGAPSSRAKGLARVPSSRTGDLARAPSSRTGDLAGARLKHRAAILLKRARLVDRARGDWQSEGRFGTLHITIPVSCQIVKKVPFLQGGTHQLTVTIN